MQTLDYINIHPSHQVITPFSRFIAVVLGPQWVKQRTWETLALYQQLTFVYLSSVGEPAILCRMYRLSLCVFVCTCIHTYDTFGPQKGIHKKCSQGVSPKELAGKLQIKGCVPNSVRWLDLHALMCSTEGFVFPLVILSPELWGKPIPPMCQSV